MTNVIALAQAQQSGEVVLANGTNKADFGASVVFLPTGTTAANGTVVTAQGIYPLTMTTSALSSGIMRWPMAAPSDTLGVNFWFRYQRGSNTKADWLFAGQKNTGDVLCLKYLANPSDGFRILDRASVAIDPANGTGAMTDGSWYQVKGSANRAAGSASLQLLDSAGASVRSFVKSSGADFGTVPFALFEGGFSAGNQIGSVSFQLIQQDDTGAVPPNYVLTTPPLVPSVSLAPTTGPVPRSDGTNGTQVTATVSTTGGNGNARTYAIVIQYSANGNFTDTVTFLDTTTAYQSSPTFTFTPLNVGAYRVTPWAQQAA